MTETIFTKHPQKGKAGQEISKKKYDLMRAAILETLTITPDLTEHALVDAVQARMATPFPGSISWYVHTVLLDLEARKMVQRMNGKKEDQWRVWPEIRF